MTTYEMDPDVKRWGLHQLMDVCSISTAGSCGSVTRCEPDSSSVEYVKEGYVEQAPSSPVENDYVIAHALQEELSRLARQEASGPSTYGNGHLEAAVLAQDWLAPSKRYLDANGTGIDHSGTHDYSQVLGTGDHNERNTRQCSIPGEGSGSDDDTDGDALNIEDECALDGEVGKRLNHMVPVPHLPKINGEIPSVDEEVSDHQRLLDRLQVYDLVENKVKGDGNCQFRALSDQLYRSPEHHRFVRQQIVQQLTEHPEKYNGYVPMAYGEYLKRMVRNGEWGDHVTLQAAADAYGVKIFMITSFKDTCYIEILPQIEKSKRVVCLSFWAEVHYNSIYPEGELPLLEMKKKKKWWSSLF
ncbi:hypothetical protein MLD38_011212 [Melastoma candidum]|uniref:Uncharacterized protein n=1 Tax=Melastoma candidum TaxID=119954 RepID=A0ACB9R3G3_9MYRT|nr:hypothetical protein MLD38_011212 [Melastoma candidum]